MCGFGKDVQVNYLHKNMSIKVLNIRILIQSYFKLSKIVLFTNP